jgi:hypothetical protein
MEYPAGDWRDFVERTVRMIRPERFDTRELRLIRLSLEYGYISGFRESDSAHVLERFYAKGSEHGTTTGG